MFYSKYLFYNFLRIRQRKRKLKDIFLGDIYCRLYNKKFFLLKKNIYGFSFQLLNFFLLSVGYNLNSFTIGSKYFLRRCFKMHHLNKKLNIFLFLIRNSLGYCAISSYKRNFFFRVLKKYRCLKQTLIDYGLPLRGQRTKTNAVTAHSRCYLNNKVKTYSFKRKSTFFFF